MKKKDYKITGIIGARENAEKHLSQMDIPEDFFTIDAKETFRDLSLMEWLVKMSKELAPRDMDADTLLGLLEFAKLDKIKNCITGQLQEGQKRRLLLLKALLCGKHYIIMRDVFEGLDEDDLEIVTEMLIEFSTFSDIILVSGNDKGTSICDELVYC